MKFSLNNFKKKRNNTENKSKVAVPFVKKTKAKKEVNKKLAKKKKLRVLIIKHDNNESTFSMNFLVTMPVKDVSINISKIYSKYAYDYKKVAEDGDKTWYVGISGPKQYASAKEELVVPDEYAKIYLASKDTEGWALIIVPYMKDVVFGIAKDGSIMYVVKKDISLFTSSIDRISALVNNIIREVSNLYPINISKTVIVDPPQPLSSEVIDLLSGLQLKPLVNNLINPSDYDGVLTLNKKYAFHLQNTPVSLLSNATKTVRNVIVYSLLFLVAFSWTYFPLHAAVGYVNMQYKKAIQDVIRDTRVIIANKSVFQEAIKDLEAKENQIEDYKKVASSFSHDDFVPILSTIMKNEKENIQSVQYSNGTFVITISLPNASYLDSYIKQLLLSGYFASIVPTDRSSQKSTYTVNATLLKQQKNNGG